MKRPAPVYDTTTRRRVTPEYYAQFEAAVIAETGMHPRPAQRLVDAVLSVAGLARPGDDRDTYVSHTLTRLSPDRYARMEAVVARRAGLPAETGRELLGHILGPLLIAPPLPKGMDHDPDRWSCPHVHYSFDGQFTQCQGDRDRPDTEPPTHLSFTPHGPLWQTGDRRDINTAEYQW